jgi:tetratricopeptide (TPR) repeat protein
VLGDVEASGTLDNIFSIQKSLARQVAAKLAIQIRFPALEVSPMTINAYQDLEHLRTLAKDLPLLGMEPARARKKSDYVLALSLCDKLLANYPQLAPARYHRALFSLHHEDFATADTESEIARQLDPDDLETLLLRGNFLWVTKDCSGAAAVFREATEKYPEDAQAWYALGVLYLNAGAKLEAIAAYLAAMERQPLIPEAETNLRTLLESAEGLTLLARLKEQKPEVYPAAAVFYAFWKNAGNRLGDLAERAMDGFPNLYIGYYMQGLLARDRKQNREAAALFQACLELQPAFPEVHRELGLLALSATRCTEGEQHLKIYMSTASFVDDYAALEEQIRRCRNRR